MKNVDVVIIGGGLAGIFTAYELAVRAPSASVLLVEQGDPIVKRSCPIVAGQVARCINCPVCDIMRGFGGAGAFSDGKFNFTTAFGGWLTDYLSSEKVMELIDYVDLVNQEFGATTNTFSTDTPEADKIRLKALGEDIHLLDARCKHLGTEKNRELLEKISDWLDERIEMWLNVRVDSIEPADQGYRIETTRGEVSSRFVVAAPGRSGAEWFAGQCRQLDLTLINNQVDLGVRVELPALVFKEITDAMYEAKLTYRTKQYGDMVRTFCMNPYGYVVSENTDGIITVNGHSYDAPELRSNNTNFALLVSNRFTAPFKEPYRYGKHIASLSNMLGGGVMVQRLGDLLDGRRTDTHRLDKSFVRPTLDATPGDLSLVLPKRHLDNIVEFLHALDTLAPGTANRDTLLYGVEVKFYSARLELSDTFETQLKNLFAIGDGAGITRGLSQAGASGVRAAREIASRLST